MKASKKATAAVLTILIILSLCSCAAATIAQPQKAEWSITVEGASKTEFNSNDYAKLTGVKVDAVLKKKDGSETKQVWDGVPLKDVLTVLGVKEYTSITLSADDYTKDYTPDIVNDAKTILGTAVNGEKLTKDGPVEAVAGTQTGNMWIRNLKIIKVNK